MPVLLRGGSHMLLQLQEHGASKRRTDRAALKLCESKRGGRESEAERGREIENEGE